MVKAFNTAFASRQADPVVDGARVDGYVAGDDAEAKAAVLQLVESIGFVPIDVGPLAMSRALEGMGLINITLNIRDGWPWQDGWKLVGPTKRGSVPGRRRGLPLRHRYPRAGKDSHEQDVAGDAGLLVLRAGVGGVLVAHGVQKLFGWLGGHGLAGTGAGSSRWASSRVGRPHSRRDWARPVVVSSSPSVSPPRSRRGCGGTMIPATAVHAPSGFFATGGGYEYPALLGVSAAALTLMGPGDWSLDARLNHRLNQPSMAAAAIIASSAVSLAIVQRRRQVLVDRAAETTSRTPHVAPADPATAVSEAP